MIGLTAIAIGVYYKKDFSEPHNFSPDRKNMTQGIFPECWFEE